MQTWSSLTSCSVSPAAPTCVKVINKLIKELIINQLTMVINKLAKVIINMLVMSQAQAMQRAIELCF